MESIIIKALEIVNYKNSISLFKEGYKSHPNFPSLMSITDTLTQIGIDNLAANVPFKHIEQLPKVFIAKLNLESQDYYIASKSDNKFFLENDNGIVKNVTREELEQYWTGIILIIEENENNLQKYSLQKATYLVPLLLLLLTAFSIFRYKYNLIESIFMLLSGIGLFVSIEILKTYFSDTNASESKFCNTNKRFSCKSIINSKSYSFSKYVEFVDLPILFFSIAFFCQILGLNILFYLGVISVISVPFLLFSIYLQKFVLKKWCLLCLLVSLLINCIGILYLIHYKAISINYQHLFSLLILSSTLITAWFLLKKQLRDSKKNLQKLNTLLRFKRKEEVFTKIALPIKNEEQFNTLHKIKIGNKDAKNTITLFLSPSCPHCHVAYKNAIELIAKYKDHVNLEICFNLNLNNIENPYLEVVKTILLLYNTNKDYKNALNDWHVKNIKLENWLTKWKSTDEFNIVNNQIENQFQWCLSNELNFAPIKIFNGLMIPDDYEINELFYFFKE
jgi:uncharacterized membrane protein